MGTINNAPQRSSSFCDSLGDIHIFYLAPVGPLISIYNAIGTVQEETSPTVEDSLSSLFDQAFATADELIQIERKCHQDIDIESVDIGVRSDEGVFLSRGKQDEFKALLAEFEDIFEPTGPPTTMAEYRIDTGDHPPIAVTPYQLPPAKRQVLREEINKMLRDGIIEECELPWGASTILVLKKNGGTRVCVDYRQLNKVTVADHYPMPRVDDLHNATRNTNVMSILNLWSGYHQVDTGNTAILFFLLLLVYIDDSALLSKAFGAYLADMKQLFEQLRKFGFRVNRNKCHFCCKQMKFLGHLVGEYGLHQDPDEVKAIVELPTRRMP